jgi:DNA-directed RNA polymerase specialized sigma24 family protein
MTLTLDQKSFMSPNELAEFEHWNEIVEEWDHKDTRKEKRLAAKKDGADITLLDREDKEEFLDTEKLLKLSYTTSYLDVVFSMRHEDIDELITDDLKSEIVRDLTDRQKQAFFLTEVLWLKTKDAAEILRTSPRNILKLKATALENVKKKYKGKIENNNHYYNYNF